MLFFVNTSIVHNTQFYTDTIVCTVHEYTNRGFSVLTIAFSGTVNSVEEIVCSK